ncbi:transferase [Mycena vulgaris]|nr:transferase [Mycena vulgaris]
MASTSVNSVSVTSRHTVRCANETSWTALESPFRMGPLDLLVSPTIPIAVVFVYDNSPDINRLQRALARLLDYYPHLSGRLQINSDTTTEIARLGTGIDLFEAQCSERLDAFASAGRLSLLDLPGAGNALLAPFESTPEGVSRDPIFTVQHTRFACGGAALGVRVLHMACDAEGFFQLVHDLAELYRGIGNDTDTPSLAHPPHIRSYLSELTSDTMAPEEREAALNFQPSLFYLEPSAPVEAGSPSPTHTASFPAPPSPIVGRFLRFSNSELSALKAKATDPNASSESWVSTFDALSAYLNQRVYRARMQLRAKDATYGELSPPNFLTPVNIRSHIGPDCLPPRYFPNSLLCTYTSFPLDVLASAPLWQVAKTLHDMTRTPATASKDALTATVRWLVAQPDKRQIKEGFRYGNGSLMLSQWNKVDMYGGAVFDAPPVLVAPPFTPISLVDGLGYFLQTREKGAIDVALALSEPIWAIFDQEDLSGQQRKDSIF